MRRVACGRRDPGLYRIGPRATKWADARDDIGPAGAPQPPLRTPSRIAWTSATLTQVAGGNAEHGAFVALNCTAYHGEQGLLAYQTATDRAEPQGYHQCATQAASRPPP